MFSNMIRGLPCESCENGKLEFNHKLTVDSWRSPYVFRLDDIGKLKDGVISDILVMECPQCGAQVRYTLKEMEKIFRKMISDRLFTLLAKDEIPDPGREKVDRLMYYCGKCSGFDGKGSCPKYIYDNCKIKRMPHGF